MALAPPSPRLPGLGALAIFAKAARLGGYAAAAESLGVTPGAVRLRVRGLEARLGQPLFAAMPRGVVLTPAGQALAQGLEAPLAALAALAPNPPFDALAGFESAVRCGGFSAAATALGLSPGAVAAQVRAVERWQATPLFARGPRGVMPLPPARALQTALAASLGAVAEALAPVGATVRIAALPAVAQLWLAPRLPALRAALPGIALSITALERPPQGKRAPYDLALFLAPSGGTLLAEDALIPVCAPALAPRLTRAADLSALPRLTDSTWDGDWRLWAQGAQVPGPGAAANVHSLYGLAVGEAVAGEGVLIGHLALLGRHLQAGLLVAPIGPAVPLAAGLRLLRQRPLARGSAAARVADWLLKG